MCVCEFGRMRASSVSLWCEVSLLGRGEVKGGEVSLLVNNNNNNEKSEDSLGDAMSGIDSIVAWNTSKSKRLME